MQFFECPRCGCESLERFPSYSYCAECNYSPELDLDHEVEIPDWALEAIGESGLRFRADKNSAQPQVYANTDDADAEDATSSSRDSA